MKKFTIRKVHLESLLRLLTDVYQSGANFIDLNGIRDDESAQDEVTVNVPLQYMAPEYMEPLFEGEKKIEKEEEEIFVITEELLSEVIRNI